MCCKSKGKALLHVIVIIEILTRILYMDFKVILF